MVELTADKDQKPFSEEINSLKEKFLAEFSKKPTEVEQFKGRILELIEEAKRYDACQAIFNQRLGRGGGASLIHRAADRCGENPHWLEIFKAMTAEGADLYDVFEHKTALEWAIFSGLSNPEPVEYLLGKWFALNYPGLLDKIDLEIEKNKQSLKEKKDEEKKYLQVVRNMQRRLIRHSKDEVANFWDPTGPWNELYNIAHREAKNNQKKLKNLEKIKNLIRGRSTLQSMLYGYVLDKNLLPSNAQGKLISPPGIPVPEEVLKNVQGFKERNELFSKPKKNG